MSHFFYNTLWHQHTSSWNTIVESIKSHLSVYINLWHKAVVASFGHIKHSFIYIYIYVYIHVFLKHPCRFHTSNSLFASPCDFVRLRAGSAEKLKGRKQKGRHPRQVLEDRNINHLITRFADRLRAGGANKAAFSGWFQRNLTLLQPLYWLEGCGLIPWRLFQTSLLIANHNLSFEKKKKSNRRSRRKETAN